MDGITVGHADTGQTHVYDNVNIAVRNFSFGAQFPFTLSGFLPNGGTLKLDGNAGPINSSDTSLTPFQAQGQCEESGSGGFRNWRAFSRNFRMADFDGTVSSDGQAVQTSGTLQAQKLQLVQSGGPAGTAGSTEVCARAPTPQPERNH